MWSQGSKEPTRCSGVTICMAIEPTKPEVISTVKARGGVTGNKVRYVLAISLVLVVAAMIFVYIGVPGGMMNGATGMHGPN